MQSKVIQLGGQKGPSCKCVVAVRNITRSLVSLSRAAGNALSQITWKCADIIAVVLPSCFAAEAFLLMLAPLQ